VISLKTLHSALSPLPFALLFFPAFTSADWDPLGADCGSNKSRLKRTEMYKPECTESTSTKSKQTKAFFCCSNQAISG